MLIPTLALILFVSGMLKHAGIWGYFIFWNCTNVDIAFVLASSEERKKYLQELKITTLKGISIGIAALVEILAFLFIMVKASL